MISIAYGGCKMDLNFVEYYLNDINSLRPELRSEFLDLFLDLYRRSIQRRKREASSAASGKQTCVAAGAASGKQTGAASSAGSGKQTGAGCFPESLSDASAKQSAVRFDTWLVAFYVKLGARRFLRQAGRQALFTSSWAPGAFYVKLGARRFFLVLVFVFVEF